MNLRLQADLPPLCQASDGVIRVSGTRISLERIVRAFRAGSTPEQIVQDYDVLSLEDAYAVVSYYLHHRSEVDAYLADCEQDAAQIRSEIEQQHDVGAIRERLLGRSSMKND